MSTSITKPKRLALTHLGLPVKGPLPDDLVLLGAWCLADRIDLSDIDRARLVVRHPWMEDVRFERDYQEIKRIYECALANLGMQLNQHHHTDLSARGWEIALGPWLRIFLNCVYERHMLLEEAVRKHAVTKVLTIEQSAERTLDTTAQFVHGVQNASWNAMFSADVVRHMFPDLELEHLSFHGENVLRSSDRGKRPRTLVNFIINGVKVFVVGLDEMLSRHRKVLIHRIGMHWRDEFKLMLRLGFIPHMFLPSLNVRSTQRDDNVRRAFTLGLETSSVTGVMEQMFRLYLPRIFVEDFSAVRKLIERRYPKRAKLIVSGVSYYVDDYFKLYAAFATDAGAKYTILQHGGGFGTPKINDEEELLLKTADNILTWGWSENTEGWRAKTVPCASLWLSKLDEVKPDPSGVLLMPVSEWTLQTFRLFSAPLSFRQLEYLDDIVRFYRQLAPFVAEQFRLRLQPNAREWRVSDRFEAAGLGRAVLRSPGRFTSDLKVARLVVVNTNSTTLLESLCLNFPTVALLDAAMSPVRENARDAFDALERVGIVHRTPEAAAKFVETIFADPTHWWGNPQLQSVRESFVSQFAARDPKLLKNLSRYFA